MSDGAGPHGHAAPGVEELPVVRARALRDHCRPVHYLEVNIEAESGQNFSADLRGGVSGLPVGRIHKAHMRAGYACLFKKRLGFFQVLRVVEAVRAVSGFPLGAALKQRRAEARERGIARGESQRLLVVVCLDHRLPRKLVVKRRADMVEVAQQPERRVVVKGYLWVRLQPREQLGGELLDYMDFARLQRCHTRCLVRNLDVGHPVNICGMSARSAVGRAGMRAVVLVPDCAPAVAGQPFLELERPCAVRRAFSRLVCREVVVPVGGYRRGPKPCGPMASITRPVPSFRFRLKCLSSTIVKNSSNSPDPAPNSLRTSRRMGARSFWRFSVP